MIVVAKQLRLHQWSKNILILIPIFSAHRLLETAAWVNGALAFLSFSLVASSVYVFNDLKDLESDRAHPTKRHRPLASGRLSAGTGWGLGTLSLVLGATLAGFLGADFAGYLLTYLFLNLAYTLRIKKIPMLDGILLACLYTLRIVAGGAATGIPISSWLLAFSLFFFLGLAMVKRFSELRLLADSTVKVGRGYLADDLGTVRSFGISASMVSLMIFSLYLNSPASVALYRHPDRLWLVLPVLLSFIGRFWLFAGRGAVHEDPVIFALRDRASWLMGFVFVGVFLAAI